MHHFFPALYPQTSALTLTVHDADNSENRLIRAKTVRVGRSLAKAFEKQKDPAAVVRRLAVVGENWQNKIHINGLEQQGTEINSFSRGRVI